MRRQIRLSEIWCWEFSIWRTVTGSIPSPSRTASASQQPPKPKRTASNPAASAPPRRKAQDTYTTFYLTAGHFDLKLPTVLNSSSVPSHRVFVKENPHALPPAALVLPIIHLPSFPIFCYAVIRSIAY